MELVDYQVEVKQGYGKRVAEFIDKSGMKAAKIAKIARVHPSTISRIVTAKQVLGDEVIEALTLCFDINATWLATGEGEMGSAELTEEGLARFKSGELTNFNQYGEGNSANYKSTVNQTPLEMIRMEEEIKRLKQQLADNNRLLNFYEETVALLKSLLPNKKI